MLFFFAIVALSTAFPNWSFEHRVQTYINPHTFPTFCFDRNGFCVQFSQSYLLLD